MSTKPTNHNKDIQRLINKGYAVAIENSCLVVRDVPYIDESKAVHEDGILFDVCPHNPSDHTFRFSAIPYTLEGKEFFVARRINGWNGFDVKSLLSFKKSDGKSQIAYADHFDKVTYYIQIMESLAKRIKSDVNARKYRPIDTSMVDDTPFQYQDLNSSRAGISHVNEKLKGQKIAIIGLGGTGSYVLDLISKSYVAEIHIYDGDTFHTHNAFRTPGATSKETLDSTIEKVAYLHGIYSNMHGGIKPHNYSVDPKIIDSEFGNYDFIFICIDANEYKKELLLKLIKKGMTFLLISKNI